MRKPSFARVADLRPAARGVNLLVKVVRISVVVESSRVRIAEALIGDESGSAVISLRNAQIDLVEGLLKNKKPGLRIQNGKVTMQRGFMRLEVDQWGVIAGDDEVCAASWTPNEGNNLSAVEYELVSVS
eukprot:tig00020918_g15887.t1